MLSSIESEVYFRRVDVNGRVPVPEQFRKIMDLHSKDYVEVQLHVIDSVPAIVVTKASRRK